MKRHVPKCTTPILKNEDNTPVEKMFTLTSMLAVKHAIIINDGRFSTNSTSADFVRRNFYLLMAKRYPIVIQYSDRDFTANSTSVLIDAKIDIVLYSCKFNWGVQKDFSTSSCAFPGIDHKPVCFLRLKSILFGGKRLPMISASLYHIKISNMGVKKFQSLLRNNCNRDSFLESQLVHFTDYVDEENAHHGPIRETSKNVTNDPKTTKLSYLTFQFDIKRRFIFLDPPEEDYCPFH